MTLEWSTEITKENHFIWQHNYLAPFGSSTGSWVLFQNNSEITFAVQIVISRISTVLAKVKKLRESAYKQSLNQNKINRQRGQTPESASQREMVDGEGGKGKRMNHDRICVFSFDLQFWVLWGFGYNEGLRIEKMSVEKNLCCLFWCLKVTKFLSN